MKLLSFDIEISDVSELRKYEDMDKYAPFNISVAATAIHRGEERVPCATSCYQSSSLAVYKSEKVPGTRQAASPNEGHLLAAALM